MLKKLFKYIIGLHKKKECEIRLENIEAAQKIFFAVFSRYGDGIISFKVILEFTEINPNKKYLLFTTNQLVPYAKDILGDSVTVMGVNKRNPFSLFPAMIKLKNFDADIGFNPWSHGDDAEFFASFTKQYSVFKRFKHWDKTYNLYTRVREYLSLEPRSLPKNAESLPNDAKNIVLVPFSTDVTKSLDVKMTKQLISKLKELYKNVEITVCGFKGELKEMDGMQKFCFSKNSSDGFLMLLKKSDLFVGVDAGPLHIANAMHIQSIGIFGPTAPETIIDFDWKCAVLRDASLSGFFCYVKDCKKAICMENAIKSFRIAKQADMIKEENIECRV